MEYLCPKCGAIMTFIGIPTKNHYKCCCGYKSKYVEDDDLLVMLPKKLQSDELDVEVKVCDSTLFI